MRKREMDKLELATQIAGKVPRGVLLNTQDGGKFNSMVIGWGMAGVEWARPIFIVYVREGRFTREQLDATGTFTVSAPVDRLPKEVFKVCGSLSGRDVDKVAEAGLTLEEPVANGVPGIAEAPLTLECRVLYRRLQDRELIPADIREEMYPPDKPSTEPMANKDYHVAYYGEIVSAYILED